MARYILVFTSVLLLCTTAFGQLKSTNKKAQRSYDAAATLLQSNKLRDAASYLEEAVATDPNFALAHQQLGDIYRRLQHYTPAIKAYEHVLLIAPELTPHTRFGLGESYLFTGQYEKAQEILRTYLTLGAVPEKTAKQANKHLADCAFALNNLSMADNLSMRHVGNNINTTSDEYFPQLTADNATIIFTRKEENQENFYESQWIDEAWTPASKLGGHVNSPEFNEGAHCISPNGKYLFFTGCNRPGGLGSCDIYVSKRENNVWSEPHNLGAPINTRGWEAQPSISADGKTLYFVSNRAGGRGGYDIWKSRLLDDGKWDIPINLGPTVNTPFDEGAPYIHADNKTLYFSSNGWPGFGKKDIFISRLDDNGLWQTPQNLGSPINDHLDQMSLHVSMDGRVAHLSTQTPDLHQDIFAFDMPTRSRPNAVAFIEGHVVDGITQAPLDALVKVTDTKTNQIMFDGRSDYLDGNFLATLPLGSTYAVHIQRHGYLFDSKNYDLENVEDTSSQFRDHIELQPIRKGSATTLNNVYFNTNEAQLLPESFADLQLLVHFLTINPDILVELSGHTDSTGHKEKNLALSEKRAKAVVEYLVTKGIPASRLKYVGHGDNLPIADNETAEGRRLNRRTAIGIL